MAQHQLQVFIGGVVVMRVEIPIFCSVPLGSVCSWFKPVRDAVHSSQADYSTPIGCERVIQKNKQTAEIKRKSGS